LNATSGAVVAMFPIQRGDNILACDNHSAVYVLAGRTQAVYAVRLSDGTELWRTPGIRSAIPNRGGPTRDQAVVTDGMFCYVQLITEERMREVIALDAQTGQERWSWRCFDRNNADNAGNLVSGWNAVYLSTSQGVFALRTRDGAQLWHALPTMDLSWGHATLSPEPTG
jgi:outer membrane protein assembly factor BamB